MKNSDIVDNYLKRKFIMYVLNVIKSARYVSYLDLERLHSYLEHLKTEFIDISLPVFHGMGGKREKWTESLAYFDEVTKILETCLKKIKKQNSLIEKKVKIVCEDLFHCKGNEYELAEILLLRASNREFLQLDDIYKRTDLCFPLGLSNYECDTCMAALRKKGFITYDEYDESELNPAIEEVMKRNDIKSKTQMLQLIFGEKQKASLKYSDFDYLGKHREYSVGILKSAIENKTKGINILLYGDVGTGKTEFAKTLADYLGLIQYTVRAENTNKEATRSERLMDLCSKQFVLANISNVCIIFDEAEDVMNRGFSDFGGASKAYLNNLLEEALVPVIWTTNNISNVDPAFLRRMTYTIEFEKLSEEKRLEIWKRVLRKNHLKVARKRLDELNKNYEIAPSIIANAVKTVKMLNGDQDDFEHLIENVSQVVLKKKSVKKTDEFKMQEYSEQLVNTDLDLSNLTMKIKNCGKLNFSMCLYGEPGTGKSLYARYLANQLGIEVLFKRASDLISMYVGETERNIAEAFAEAKNKKAMLIFDEADSFLQNRNQAYRSWEISQVNEMLTWMESHQYPFICTTNLLECLDEASLRRFTFKVKFDFMNKNNVNEAFKYFFGITGMNVKLHGVTAGDFATVKKKADFLNVVDPEELIKMLEMEVKLKRTKNLKKAVGF